MRKLSPSMKEALAIFADPFGYAIVKSRTVQALVNRGLVRHIDEPNRRGFTITDKGREIAKEQEASNVEET
jgi:predicted transcriptional regulator